MRSRKILSWSAGIVAESKPISPFPKIPIRGIEGNNFLWKLRKIRIMAYFVLLWSIFWKNPFKKMKYEPIFIYNECIFWSGIVIPNIPVSWPSHGRISRLCRIHGWVDPDPAVKKKPGPKPILEKQTGSDLLELSLKIFLSISKPI